MDIRLKTLPFEFDGRQYALCCNMNVLADVQEAFGGEIRRALSGPTTARSLLEFLTAMLNDYGEEQGWPRLTSRQVGRRLPAGQLDDIRRLVIPLITSSLQPEEGPGADDADGAEGDPKN